MREKSRMMIHEQGCWYLKSLEETSLMGNLTRDLQDEFRVSNFFDKAIMVR
jgi:hypothetical protein